MRCEASKRLCIVATYTGARTIPENFPHAPSEGGKRLSGEKDNLMGAKVHHVGMMSFPRARRHAEI